MRVEPLAIEVGLGLVGLVEGAQDSAAAAAHRLHSQAIGHRTGLYAAAGSRHRQSLSCAAAST